MSDKAKKLFNLLSGDKVIRIVGAHNPLGARIVERAGFEGIWSSSLEISASHGVPDASILGMDTYCHTARLMNEAVSIPVIADCDTGYGNANNVIYMTKMFENSGIAGVCIEDKLFPKDNSLLEGGRQNLASIEEFTGKIRAIVDTRKSKESLLVIARIEALIAGWGQAAALERAEAYVEAGADAILIHSKQKTPDEVIEFIRAFKNKKPVVLVPTKYPTITIDDLKTLGVRIVIYANHGLRASIAAMESVLGKIACAGCLSCVENELPSMEHVFELQGTLAIKDIESRYLPMPRTNEQPKTLR